MRILHVVSTGERRGAEIFAADLVRALGAEGRDQRVAILRANGRGDVAYDAETSILGPDDRVVQTLRLDPRRAMVLRDLVGRTRPDVIQAHGGEALKYCAAAGVRAGPIVYRKIGRLHPKGRRGLRRSAHRWWASRAARVVIVAEALRRETQVLLDVPERRIVCIPNGVDAARLRPTTGRAAVRDGLGIAPRAPVMLSIAALTWEKDPLAHVEVAAHALRSCPQAFFVMIGDGPLRERVREAAREAGVDGRIVLAGQRADVADVLGASDMLLVASRTEGMPASVIEAGMAGLPVAAFAVAGVPEVVVDHRTGLLAHAGDVEELATLATKLLEDAELRAALGRAGMATCRARFDIAAVAARYAELYDTVVSRP